jgi:hypothetical protein
MKFGMGVMPMKIIGFQKIQDVGFVTLLYHVKHQHGGCMKQKSV